MQVEASIRGVSPGVDLERYLVKHMNLARRCGAVLLALLVVAACLLDEAAERAFGCSINAVSLLLLTGYVMSLRRQVPLGFPSPGHAFIAMPQLALHMPVHALD